MVRSTARGQCELMLGCPGRRHHHELFSALPAASSARFARCSRLSPTSACDRLSSSSAPRRAPPPPPRAPRKNRPPPPLPRFRPPPQEPPPPPLPQPCPPRHERAPDA